jgi:uncharacterized protein (TIGR04255 family)
MTTPALGSWRNPPLAYVVAELIISPYYSIGSAIPGLQDTLRSAYPRTVEVQELVLDANAPVGPQQAWRLISADLHHGVQIGPRAIALHATSYIDSKDFLGRWSAVLSAIAAADLGAFVERAGLRYVDLIVPTGGANPSAYLAPGLQGVPLPDGGDLKNAMWVTGFEVDGCVVHARTAAPSPEGALLPPNFNALPLRKPKIMIDGEERKGEKLPLGFIDVDCIADLQEVFDSTRLSERFVSMQRLTSKTFKSLLSETALREWQ